jgi:hypothetical protein
MGVLGLAESTLPKTLRLRQLALGQGDTNFTFILRNGEIHDWDTFPFLPDAVADYPAIESELLRTNAPSLANSSQVANSSTAPNAQVDSFASSRSAQVVFDDYLPDHASELQLCPDPETASDSLTSRGSSKDTKVFKSGGNRKKLEPRSPLQKLG